MSLFVSLCQMVTYQLGFVVANQFNFLCVEFKCQNRISDNYYYQGSYRNIIDSKLLSQTNSLKRTAIKNIKTVSSNGFIMSIHDLPRLCITDLSRSNKRKWLHTKNIKERETVSKYLQTINMIMIYY